MKDRIKKIRKDHHLNQSEFAQRLNLKRSTVAGYEVGQRTPIPAIMAMICDKFSVSMHWLETGEGDPYLEKPADHGIAEEIRAILKDEDPFMAAVLTSLAQMPPAWWAEWSKALHAEADRIRRESHSSATK